MSGSCCARLRRANVEFAAFERPSKAVVPKSVQIASAVAYATAHEACAAHAKTRLAAPLRSFAAPLRSPTVFLRVQHMASCAARGRFELAGCKTLEISTIETSSSCLSILQFATGPKRSMGHFLGGEKIHFLNSRY